MKKLKNGFSNNIIIYQMPLIERILGIVSAVFLTLLPIVGLIVPLYEDIKEFFMLLGLLLAMIMYCIFMYFIVFKTYICIDIKNNKIVIRKFPGYKKEELSLYGLVDIKVSDGLPAEFKDFFYNWYKI